MAGSTPVFPTMETCKGCGREATFKTDRGTWWCDTSHTRCPRIKEKFVANRKVNVHSEVTKRKISDSMKGNRNANHRGDRQSYYNGIRMDSRWEIGVAAYLDRIGASWKYGEKRYRLSDGRYYHPDFFLYDAFGLTVIEVKGYFRESNRIKFQQFLSEFPDVKIELWERKKLTDLGIIDREGYLL